MKKKRRKENMVLFKILTIVFIICFAIQLLLTNFFIVYYLEFKKTSKFNSNSDNVLKKNVFYFLEGEEKLSPVFSEKERTHLFDVKNLILSVKIFFIIMLLFLFLLFEFIRNFKGFYWQVFIKHSLFSLAVLTIFSVGLFFIIKINFQIAFSIFHSLFFKPETWIFNHYDLIIQLFPEDYFIKTGSKIFVLLISELIFISILLMLKYFSLKKKIF